MKTDGLIALGVLIYVLLSCLDRFIVSVPNFIYIPVMIVGIALVLVGGIQKRRKGK